MPKGRKPSDRGKKPEKQEPKQSKRGPKPASHRSGRKESEEE